MKKTRNTSTKVVAISTIAVVVLAGASIVSLHSLAQNDEAVRAGLVGGLDADTASGRLSVRPDEAVSPAVDSAAPAAEAVSYEYSYAAPEAQVVSVDETIEVVDSVVEQVERPDEVPVIAVAQVAEVQEEAPAVPELKVDATQQIFLPAEEPAEEVFYDEAVVAEAVYLDVVDSSVDFEYDWEAYDRPERGWNDFEYEEPVAEVVAVEEPVAELVAVEEPVYEEPVYVPEVPADNMVYVPETTTEPVAETDSTSTASTSTTSTVRQAIVDYAASRVGVTPYVWAGRSLETGTDCSGFVNLIYNNFGYYASAGSSDYQDVQGDWGTNISYDDLQIGDVVVYYGGGHVGIYAGQDENGNDLVIHDSNEVDGVKISEMDYSTPTAYVRIIDDDYDYAETSTYSYDSYDDSSDDTWSWDNDWNDWN